MTSHRESWSLNFAWRFHLGDLAERNWECLHRNKFAAADAARRIWLEFDGAYRDASVWLNGQFVGRHLSGYTSFHFDVTELCEFGGDNALAVRVDATEFELWSYEGGGIYRDVRLVKTAPLRVAPWGVFVQAEPCPRAIRVAPSRDRADAARGGGGLPASGLRLDTARAQVRPGFYRMK